MKGTIKLRDALAIRDTTKQEHIERINAKADATIRRFNECITLLKYPEDVITLRVDSDELKEILKRLKNAGYAVYYNDYCGWELFIQIRKKFLGIF